MIGEIAHHAQCQARLFHFIYDPHLALLPKRFIHRISPGETRHGGIFKNSFTKLLSIRGFPEANFVRVLNTATKLAWAV